MDNVKCCKAGQVKQAFTKKFSPSEEQVRFWICTLQLKLLTCVRMKVHVSRDKLVSESHVMSEQKTSKEL